MAVPGPVHSAAVRGAASADPQRPGVLVTSADEVLELVSPAGQHTVPTRSGPTRATDSFDATTMAVYEAVPARRPVSAGEIALVAGVSMPACLAQLAGAGAGRR